MARPKTNKSTAEKELDKVQEQFETFEQEIKDLTLDRMNEAPKIEVEPQTKIAQKDLARMGDVYLKPHKTIGSREKFNEDYRQEYRFKSEYVQFTAENREIIGEMIELWTKPFAGMPAEFWQVPVNKPVWGPRYLAERIKGCSYHRMVMDESPTHSSNGSQFYGRMIVDNTVQRLDAVPVSSRKSIFMGASGF